jgi:hypothetical protein
VRYLHGTTIRRSWFCDGVHKGELCALATTSSDLDGRMRPGSMIITCCGVGLFGQDGAVVRYAIRLALDGSRCQLSFHARTCDRGVQPSSALGKRRCEVTTRLSLHTSTHAAYMRIHFTRLNTASLEALKTERNSALRHSARQFPLSAALWMPEQKAMCWSHKNRPVSNFPNLTPVHFGT